MERDPSGGSDVGRDIERDLGDEPPAAIRDAAPDYLAPIDDVRAGQRPHARARGHDVGRRFARARLGARAGPHLPGASGRSGRRGSTIESIDRDALAAHAASEPRPAAPRRGSGRSAGRLHDRCRRLRHRRQRRPPAVVGRRAGRDPGRRDAQPRPLVGDGAVDRRDLRRPAAHQLGHRRRLGRRPDPAARGRRPPRRPSSAPHGRILVGLPERHLLTAGSLRPDDDDFAALFADFVVEQSGGADEPIDRRVFELVDGRLVEFDGADAGLMAGDRGATPAFDVAPLRGRRRDRDDHARPARGAQRADGPDEGGAAGGLPDSIARDRSVRAVVLTGAGRAFCAGQDLKERLETGRGAARRRAARALQPDHPRDARARPADRRGDQRRRRRGRRVARLRLRPPDRRREAPASCSPSGGSGSCPDSGATWFLPRLVGPAKAAELALLGDTAVRGRRGAVRAGRAGRARPTRSPTRLGRWRSGWPRSRRGALASTKHALDRTWSIDLDAALEDEAYRQGIAGRDAPTTPRGWRPSSRSGRRGSPGSSRSPTGACERPADAVGSAPNDR